MQFPWVKTFPCFRLTAVIICLSVFHYSEIPDRMMVVCIPLFCITFHLPFTLQKVKGIPTKGIPHPPPTPCFSLVCWAVEMTPQCWLWRGCFIYMVCFIQGSNRWKDNHAISDRLLVSLKHNKQWQDTGEGVCLCVCCTHVRQGMWRSEPMQCPNLSLQSAGLGGADSEQGTGGRSRSGYCWF